MMNSHLIGKENRLIYRLAEDVQSKVRYTSRVADANASRQEMQRAQNQLATSSNVQSIDPATGQLVTRSISGPLMTTTAGGQQATQDMQARAAGVDYNAVQGGTRTGPSSADIMDQATISAQGLRTNFNQTTGNIRSDNTRVNTGQIDESARERLMDNGMTPTQAALSVQGNRGDVQQAFNQVGTNSASDATGSSSNIESQVRQQYADLGISDPAIINNAIASAIQADNARNQAADFASKKESSRAADSAASNAAANAATENAGQSVSTDPATAGIQAAIQGLPPEMQGFGQAIMASLQSLQQNQVDNQNAYGQISQNNQTMLGGITKTVEDALNAQRTTAAAVEEGLKETRERNEKYITDQEAAAKERLEWGRLQQERDIKRNQQKAVDQKIASLALRGGFGSGAGLSEVDEVNMSYENALQDLQSEVGVQRTELAAKFTGLYVQAQNDYTLNSINNMKELTGNLERISFQGLSSTNAIVQAENQAIQTFTNNQTQARTAYANAVTSAQGQIVELINTVRDDKRSQEAAGWTQLKQAMDIYGSNIPQPLLDSISQKMPNVNLQEVINTPTLAQQKKLSGGTGNGGGGSVPSFSVSERTTDGQPVPLEAWMQEREMDWHNSTRQAGPASPDQRKAWEKEYKAKLAAEAVMSPTAIMRDWKIKQGQTGNFSTLGAMQITQKNVEDAIARGDYQEARDIVDGIGAKPPEKSIAQITTTQRVLNDLSRMEQLIDKVEMNIGPLPTQGALWEFINENIETSPEYAELVQLRDSNLAPYSRGVSGEKGATTEPDVQRAISSLIDINSSPQAVKASLQRAKSQANESISIYLQGMRDGGYRVKALSDTYESGSWQTSNSSLTPEQQSWLNSL